VDTFFGIPIGAYRRSAREWGPFVLVLVLFFLSGAAGLVYQVVWTRKLVLLFGTTAYAVSTVLSVFFLGLGLGSLWGGRIADRSPNPLRVYAIFEVLIGAWAVLFIVGIDRGESLVAGALQAMAATRAGGVALRALLAAAFLLVPVTLMGATLPLLSKTIGRSDRTRGLRIGLLYVINTAGAVTGCVFAGTYAIEMYGYTATTFIAAAANVGIGLLAFGAARALRDVLAGPPAPIGQTGPAGATTGGTMHRAAVLVPIAFAVSGFCTLALEVLWTRLLTLVFMGTTYAYTAMLASILVGIALGSLIAAAVADRTKSPVFAFGLVECAAGIACAATLIFIERLPQTVRYFQHEYSFAGNGPMSVLFASSFTVLLVPTIFVGMTFPFAVRAVAASHARLGNDIGRLYGLNTFGGVFGAVAGGYVLLPMLGAHRGVFALGAVLVVVGALLVVTSARHIVLKIAALAIVAGAIAYTAPRIPRDVSESLNASYVPPEHHVVAFREGVEGTVAVSEPRGNLGNSNRALWINGVQATQSILKGVRMNRFQGVLPFVFDRDPKNALLICFGSGITAGTLATSDLEVTGVELAHDVLDMAHLFEEDNWRALENPRLHMAVDDGRNYLLTHEDRYDIVTFEPMPLAVAGVSTFYSREFYELCRARLAPGGIVVQWAPLHATNLDVVRAVLRTFHDVFPECSAWFVNADLFVVGSDRPLHIDLAKAARRMDDPRIAEGMRGVGFNDVTDMLSCFFMSTDAIAAFSKDAPLMHDDRPWVEFLVPRILRQATVDESLRALIPHFESPLEHVAAAPYDDPALHDRLDRRYQARRVTLRGIEAVYQGGFGSGPEHWFEQALDIDPTEALALAYYQEIAPQRVAQFVRGKEYEKAEAYLDRYARYVPGNTDAWALRAQVDTARGEAEGPHNAIP